MVFRVGGVLERLVGFFVIKEKGGGGLEEKEFVNFIKLSVRI